MWWRHSMTSYLFSGLGLSMWYLVILAIITGLFLNNAEMSMEALFYPLEILHRWCAFSQRYILSIQISWRHLMTSQSASMASFCHIFHSLAIHSSQPVICDTAYTGAIQISALHAHFKSDMAWIFHHIICIMISFFSLFLLGLIYSQFPRVTTNNPRLTIE